MSATAKLLSVNNYHYRRGGAEAVYFEHDKLFRDLGWETAFFSMQHPENIACAQERFFVDEIELSHDYSLVKKLSAAHKIVYSFEARRKLAALLDEFSPDIAHIHSVYHHISPSVLSLLKGRGVPIVLTAHDLKLLCPAYTMLSNGSICEDCRGGHTWNVTRKKCIKNSLALSLLVGLEAYVHGLLKTYAGNVDRVVTPSRFYHDKFIEWGWPADQLQYIPNYVEADKFVPNFAPGQYFLYFGRLVKDKGVHTLIEAAAMAGQKLHVAGTGPDADELKELAIRSGADVEFLGFCAGEKLHSVIRNARAVVLPSEWYENAPISVLESYALGKPLIGANIGGIPEMISVGETGWLFESGSADALARRMRESVAASPAHIESMGRAARQLVEQRYTSVHYVEAMQKLYAAIAD